MWKTSFQVAVPVARALVPGLPGRVVGPGTRRLLVDGPFSIRPPLEVDDYGWLECDLRLTQSTDGVAESAAV